MIGLDFGREGRNWPNRSASRFVVTGGPRAGGLRWHVQVMGEGPALLLVHGTGASTHSWRDLAPLLARRFTVVAPDLPGHGFTAIPETPDGLSLPGMAGGLADLLAALGIVPAIAAGHSAGAAVLARMSLDGVLPARAIIGLNAAIVPLQRVPGPLFSGIARVLVALPLVPRLFARRARARGVVEKLIRDTGSTIDPAGLTQYATLMSSPGHVSGALGMMANWDLRPLERDLPRLLPGRVPGLTLLVGENDRTVPPDDALRVRALRPASRIARLPGLGHLAHEERPDLAAGIVEAAWEAAWEAAGGEAGGEAGKAAGDGGG